MKPSLVADTYWSLPKEAVIDGGAALTHPVFDALLLQQALKRY